MREECQISEYAITVYEEPKSTIIMSAAHSFVYSQGFILTELRSILLFMLMGAVYYGYNWVIERYSETAPFQFIVSAIRILCSHIVDILIAAWIIWIMLTITYL